MNRLKKTSAGAGRSLQYRAPVDCSRKEPPYGSREIVRWMMLDGRRMKRHNSPFAALADNNARGRIAMSWSERVSEPSLKARGVSHDEELAAMVAGGAVLALIVLVLGVIA